MSRIELIGISGTSLSSEQWTVLRHCCAIAASRRHQPLVADIPVLLIAISPVATMLNQVEELLAMGDVAVLASGDPLFFGIGRTLLDRFGPDQIRVHPALSAAQLACSRFCVPWDDLTVLSLHGRSADNVVGQVLRHSRTLLFTDNQNTPDRIAARLISALTDCDDHERLAALHMRVAQNLGLPDEQLIDGGLAAMAERTFSSLNMVLIEQPVPPVKTCFGLSENDIQHSRGLITKDEIRAAALHRLQLPATGIFWDIGGGSGSISLEASRLCPDLAIYTVEKKAEEQANIRANIRRYGSYSIRPINGEAPEILAGLPDPDRIFIGGSGGQLEAILATATARLKPEGRIVISAVLEQTATTAITCLQELGLQVHVSTLTVTRQQYSGEAVKNLNPITLITGTT